MTAVLLSVHVVAAVVLIGPITAAASLFPRYGRDALTAAQDGAPDVAVARALHRISAGYTLPAVAVPVFGIATAARMGVLGQVWVWVSMALTALAAGLLVGLIVPRQRRVLHALDETDRAQKAEGADEASGVALGDQLRRLSSVTGLFALTWVVVTVLMIVRPGSTTGVL